MFVRIRIGEVGKRDEETEVPGRKDLMKVKVFPGLRETEGPEN